MKKSLIAGATLAAFVAVAAAQPAAAKTVYMGPPPAAQKKFEQSTSVNQYFPKTITVRRGKSVSFVAMGFHNLDLPAKGDKPTDLIAPSGTVSGVNDAAGNPFWFNGLPGQGFNPALFVDNFGKTVGYNGKNAVQSGLPLAEDVKPIKVKFTKLGTFTYYCDVHPGMKGKVQVKKSRKGVKSERSDRKAIAKQVTKANKDEGKLNLEDAPANTINAGVQRNYVEHLGFVPTALTVPVGTTVKFQMPVKGGELHTASTGPGDPLTEPTSYMGTIAAGFEQPVFDPRGIYPSEAPTGPSVVTPTHHGNGFWSSGALDSVAATAVPRESTVQINAAGTYTFICFIHPFMKATVTAQ